MDWSKYYPANYTAITPEDIEMIKELKRTPPVEEDNTNNKSDDIQLMIVKQSTLKCAVELNGQGGDRSQIIKDAQYFTDWVMDDCCANKPSENNDNNNDMPF